VAVSFFRCFFAQYFSRGH